MRINKFCSALQNVVDDKVQEILTPKAQTFVSSGFDSFSSSKNEELKIRLLSQLETLLKKQKNQDITGNIADKIKCFFGYGSKKTELCIQKLKNDEISLSKLENYLKKYLKSQEGPKNPITPEIEEQLENYAKRLSIELCNLKNQSAKNLENFVGFSEGGKYYGKNNDFSDSYRKIKTRAKSEESILAKLKSKFESGKLKLVDNDETNLKLVKEAIADAYGTRLQLKSVSQADYNRILSKYGITEEEFNKNFNAYLKNPNKKIKEKYLIALDDLKEFQTKDIFETLLKGIKNDSIEITEITNYGNEISSYFTKRQLVKLTDAYNLAHPDKFLKITTKDNSDIARKIATTAEGIISQEKIGDKLLTQTEMAETLGNKKFKTSTGKELLLKEIAQNKGSVKDSGYPSMHINIIQKLSNGNKETLGFNEFQIRGTQVNVFGDVEHIPYDIRQEKITKENVKYRKIYNIIKSMTKKQYKKYNKYLTNVYTYLRLQELGVSIGRMPVLNLGKNFPNEKIDYAGLCEFKHI